MTSSGEEKKWSQDLGLDCELRAEGYVLSFEMEIRDDSPGRRCGWESSPWKLDRVFRTKGRAAAVRRVQARPS